MKKSKFSKIGYNLIILSGGLTIWGYMTLEKGEAYEWLFYIGSIAAIAGGILFYKGRQKN